MDGLGLMDRHLADARKVSGAQGCPRNANVVNRWSAVAETHPVSSTNVQIAGTTPRMRGARISFSWAMGKPPQQQYGLRGDSESVNPRLARDLDYGSPGAPGSFVEIGGVAARHADLAAIPQPERCVACGQRFHGLYGVQVDRRRLVDPEEPRRVQ